MVGSSDEPCRSSRKLTCPCNFPCCQLIPLTPDLFWGLTFKKVMVGEIFERLAARIYFSCVKFENSDHCKSTFEISICHSASVHLNPINTGSTSQYAGPHSSNSLLKVLEEGWALCQLHGVGLSSTTQCLTLPRCLSFEPFEWHRLNYWCNETMPTTNQRFNTTGLLFCFVCY